MFQEITQVMNDQELAWSSGDIDRFMLGYWQSDSLCFVGSRGPQYGWHNTLEMYKTSYPDPSVMGDLEFEVLNFKPLGRQHALIVGKYTLDREDLADLEGYFTIVWRKVNGQWVIISDQSN